MQVGMCTHRRLRSACASAQSNQSSMGRQESNGWADRFESSLYEHTNLNLRLETGLI